MRYVYPANVLYFVRSRIGMQGYGLPSDWQQWCLEGDRLHHTSRVGQRLPPLTKLGIFPASWWKREVSSGDRALASLADASERAFGRWLRREMERWRTGETVQVLVNTWWSMCASVSGSGADAVVYDCADNFREYPGEDALRVDWAERRAANSADLVVVSSIGFAERVRPWCARIEHVPNGVSAELLEERLGGAKAGGCGAQPKPIVIYHGVTLAWRFDWSLVSAVAALCPDYIFRIHTSEGPPGDVRLPSNVEMMSWIPPSELGAALSESALGFMPYVLREPTLSGFPLKLFEYLAVGLPVVSTALVEVSRFEDWVSVCSNDPARVAAAIRAEIEGDSNERRAERRAFAEGYTWGALGREYRTRVMEFLEGVG